MLVELGSLGVLRQAVEVGEQVELLGGRGVLAEAAHQVVDQRLGMNLLLDVERRRGHVERRKVLLVFAAPDKLRVEVAVAPRVGNTQRAALVVRIDHRLILDRRDVLPLGLAVGEGIDFLATRGLAGHRILCVKQRLKLKGLQPLSDTVKSISPRRSVAGRRSEPAAYFLPYRHARHQSGCGHRLLDWNRRRERLQFRNRNRLRSLQILLHPQFPVIRNCCGRSKGNISPGSSFDGTPLFLRSSSLPGPASSSPEKLPSG